jgi:hypothetical protein
MKRLRHLRVLISFQHATGESDAMITLTLVNSYVLSGITSVRGIDYADTYDEIFVTDYGTDVIYNLNPSNGALNYTIVCPPEIPQVLGIVYQWNAADELFINDWRDVHDVWKYTGTWAYAFASPVPQEPRGMDMDDLGYIWGQDASSRQLYRFDQTGGNVSSWPMPECPTTYSCGVAVFPFGANLGIVLSGYAWGGLYFYEFDGTDVTFLGTAPLPMTCTSSYGLTYSYNTDSFFWVSRNSTVYSIGEFTAVIETALQRDTWGGIKATF